MAGLYIHIPFCKSRCIYCGFYSTTLLSRRQAYVDALCEEMRLREKPPIETIYIGGGTPSQLTADQLHQLFSAIYRLYSISADAEVTMECNPDDVNPMFASMLSSLPVNRVSMGIQSFNDQRLRFLHRRHTSRQAADAVYHLREAGLSNISIDLMFGFPGQTLAEFDNDISQAIALRVQHISSYSLTIEDHTPLYEMIQQGKLAEIDDEQYEIMYNNLVGRLSKAGYEHYEISNFALPGYRSRHNSSYWMEKPYLGIGAAAHSYDGAARQWNVSNLENYIASIEEQKIPMEREQLSLYNRYNDLITTALRTSWGINIEKTTLQYGRKLSHHLLSEASRWLKSGHLEIDNGWLRLTLKGIAVSDRIMSDLVFIE